MFNLTDVKKTPANSGDFFWMKFKKAFQKNILEIELDLALNFVGGLQVLPEEETRCEPAKFYV